jgi:Flp pilus assembly protein TadD
MGRRRLKESRRGGDTGAPRAPAATPAPAAERTWLCAVLLALAAILTYGGARGAGFIWDDDAFLTNNPLIHAADGLHRFWFTGEPVDYWPLTSSTLWLEWRLWGMNPLGYHVTNVLLHACEVVLLWRVLAGLRVPGAFLAAAVFAVHPVNVETVAWITQRKNLVAMFFYLVSILLFLRSEDKPPRGGRGVLDGAGWLGLSLAAFILAMLGKGSVAMLPFVLVGIVAWRRPVERNDWIRVAPFFACAAVLVAVNISYTVHAAETVARPGGPLERLLGAGAVVWFYLYKALLPFHLVFVYANWSVRADDIRWWLPLAGAVGMTMLLWGMRHRWGRGWFFAWGYFCVSLVPVMGFTNVYFMRYSLVSDHYAHLALIGAIAPVAAAFALLRRRLAAPGRQWADAAALAAVVALAWLSWRQCAMYTDLETLYRTTIAGNPQAWMPQNNLATVLLKNGRLKEGEAVCRKGLELSPDNAELWNTLGIALDQEGRPAEAIPQYQKAVSLNHGFEEAYNNLGTAFLKTGQAEEAILNYQMALYYKPRRYTVLNNLGEAYLSEGRYGDAISCFRRALDIRGDFAFAHANLGTALLSVGKVDEAIGQLQAALRLDPGNRTVRKGLDFALKRRATGANAAGR